MELRLVHEGQPAIYLGWISIWASVLGTPQILHQDGKNGRKGREMHFEKQE